MTNYYFIYPEDITIHKTSKMLFECRYLQVFRSPFNFAIACLYLNIENTETSIMRFWKEYMKNWRPSTYSCLLFPDELPAHTYGKYTNYSYPIPDMLIFENSNDAQSVLGIIYKIYFFIRHEFYYPRNEQTLTHGEEWKYIEDRSRKYMMKTLFK